MLRFYNFVDEKQSKTLRNLLQFGSNHIYPNPRNDALARILDHRANALLQQTILICIALAIALSAFAIYPVYVYVFGDIRPIFLPFILPFFNPQSNSGYFCGLFVQLGISYFGVFGNYGYEISSSVILNNLWAATDVIQFSLNEFTLNLYGYQFDRERRTRNFRNVLRQLQDVDQ